MSLTEEPRMQLKKEILPKRLPLLHAVKKTYLNKLKGLVNVVVATSILVTVGKQAVYHVPTVHVDTSDYIDRFSGADLTQEQEAEIGAVDAKFTKDLPALAVKGLNHTMLFPEKTFIYEPNPMEGIFHIGKETMVRLSAQIKVPGKYHIIVPYPEKLKDLTVNGTSNYSDNDQNIIQTKNTFRALAQQKDLYIDFDREGQAMVEFVYKD
ncbi:MAG: hypothetical protein ACK4NC_03925 [Candidatus Gracilibacteria bacterium]